MYQPRQPNSDPCSRKLSDAMPEHDPLTGEELEFLWRPKTHTKEGHILCKARFEILDLRANNAELRVSLKKILRVGLHDGPMVRHIAETALAGGERSDEAIAEAAGVPTDEEIELRALRDSLRARTTQVETLGAIIAKLKPGVAAAAPPEVKQCTCSTSAGRQDEFCTWCGGSRKPSEAADDEPTAH